MAVIDVSVSQRILLTGENSAEIHWPLENNSYATLPSYFTFSKQFLHKTWGNYHKSSPVDS